MNQVVGALSKRKHFENFVRTKRGGAWGRRIDMRSKKVESNGVV